MAAGHAGAALRTPQLLLTVVVTLDCLRVNEVARLQVCDLWFNFLMSYGVPGFDGALAACLAAGHAGAASRSPRLLLTAVVTLGCLRVN